MPELPLLSPRPPFQQRLVVKSARELRSEVTLTAYNRFRSELNDLVLQFLPEPLHVLFRGLVGLLEALSVRRRYLVIDLLLQNIVVRRTPRSMSGQRQRGNRIAVVGQLPRNEILALRLILLVPVLAAHVKVLSIECRSACSPGEQA